MSSLKTLFVVAILVAGLYGAYVVLNYNPEVTTPPEIADELPSGLAVSPGTVTTGVSSGTMSSGSASRWSSEPSSPPAPAYGTSEPAVGSGVAASSPAPAYVAQGSAAPSYYSGDSGVGTNSAGPSAVAPSSPGAADAPSPLLPPVGTAGDPSPAPVWPNQGPSAVSPDEASQLAQPAGFTQPMTGMGGSSTNGSMAASSAPPESYPTQPGPAPTDREEYATFVGRVNEMLNANRLADAHLALSQRYTDPRTSPDEARQLEELLDQLAGTVIYSSRSLLEAPYEVLATDTLESIAARYNVPAGLLVKINGLAPGVPVQPGQQIKVVRGPFEAVVDLGRHELTLLLGGERYAGRFQIGIGPELRREGTFMVTDKRDLSVPGPDGTIPAGGTLGTRWIGLGQHMGMHGTSRSEPLGRPVEQGCISLGQRDIEDLYDILSVGSTVVIRR